MPKRLSIQIVCQDKQLKIIQKNMRDIASEIRLILIPFALSYLGDQQGLCPKL